MRPCAVCQNPVEPFLSFGRMPIANGFLTEAQFAGEFFFELMVGFCARCCMVQLTERVEREKLFHGNYAFFSSTSSFMAGHFQRFAKDVRARHLAGANPFAVEIGSNDGILLQHYARAGIRHLGIEPSGNVADVARGKGVRTVSEFFDEALARSIVAEHGQADAILGANVMCHLSNLHSAVAGIRLLLKPSGVLVFEDPYLGDIVEKTAYYQIYDEHACYFSLTALDHLFAAHGMEIVDAAPQEVHGGSMRFTATHNGAHAPAAAVDALRQRERALGLCETVTFERFRRSVETSREDLTRLLRRLKQEGKRVVGYGATSKSTTVTNYCGITPEFVEFISDTTPIKQGKFSPGTHIPVRPHAEFAGGPPDYALLFAWNHGREIMAKERPYTASGGKWITYVPCVQVSG